MSVKDTLQLPATGTATSTLKFNSEPLDLLASSFNSTLSTAINQHFRWQAEPVGNDTASPSGKLNLLYAPGATAPAETGLSINNKGIVTFAPGQTIPKVTGNETVTGILSATQLISTVATGTPPLKVTSTTQVANLNASFLEGKTASAFASVTASNTFPADQFFQSNGLQTIVGDPGCGPGFAAIGFGGLSGCNNYAILGSSSGDTFINRSLGRSLLFREGNNDQVIIAPGGAVTVGNLLRVTVGDTNAVSADNNSPSGSATGFFENDETSVHGNAVLDAGGLFGPGGTFSHCLVDTDGNLSCTGSKSAVVPVDNDQRKVALYAEESAENWFADYGSGQLVNGVATVRLDPTYAQTVNTSLEYHVFLTPKGDCKGLYVTNETAGSFEVHELQSGHSNIAFDYRIIAKRKGYEEVRMEDKTAMMKAAEANAARLRTKPAAAAKLGATTTR